MGIRGSKGQHQVDYTFYLFILFAKDQVQIYKINFTI